MTNFAIRLLISTLFACLGFSACRYLEKQLPEPVPISQRLTWDGRVADKYSAYSVPKTDSLAKSGLVKVHEFEFAGTDSVTLWLREYSQPYMAYADFQRRATSSEMFDGYYRNGPNLVFFHGPFAGELEFTQGGRMPAHFLKEKLSFQGEPLFMRPPEFSSFPLLGRIPHSERVLPEHFLGRNWQGPVFSISYRCHGDTATAFRALAQDPGAMESWFREWQGVTDTLGWGRRKELRFQGWDEFHQPLVLWVYADAVVGMEGCSDGELATEYTRKLGKIRVLWPEP